jgi:cytochrome P450
MVAYNVFAMHRRTDLWGKDAKSFRPERWEENAKHGWEYLPFNGGPRICLGRKLTASSFSPREIRKMRDYRRWLTVI